MTRPIRFRKIRKSHVPKGTMDDAPLDDAVRRVVSPSNVSFINGSMMLTTDGIRELCQAVISGRISGNPDQCNQLLTTLDQKYPQ